jgi:hypothetical protein
VAVWTGVASLRADQHGPLVAVWTGVASLRADQHGPLVAVWTGVASRSARSVSSRLDRSGEFHDLRMVFRIKVQGSWLENKLKSHAQDLMKSTLYYGMYCPHHTKAHIKRQSLRIYLQANPETTWVKDEAKNVYIDYLHHCNVREVAA